MTMTSEIREQVLSSDATITRRYRFPAVLWVSSTKYRIDASALTPYQESWGTEVNQSMQPQYSNGTIGSGIFMKPLPLNDTFYIYVDRCTSRQPVARLSH